jgi:dolichol-phosphate mannosyltransferase
MFDDQAMSGWESTVIPTYLVGCLQLPGIGMVGGYIVENHLEVKNRPLYFVDTVCGLIDEPPHPANDELG